MREAIKTIIQVISHPGILLKTLGEYFGFGRWHRLKPVNDEASLQDFLNTRASFVAQTSLYGYLRTRAGMRYPELFDDPPFVKSINIAKWQIWLACLSDLAVYAGGLLMHHPDADEKQVSNLVQTCVINILENTGIPADAGDKYSDGVAHIRQRLSMTNWQSVTDDEGPFTHSPQALLDWAPVVDEFKQLDGEIVINSVRFRWQSVREDLRKTLRTDLILENSLPTA